MPTTVNLKLPFPVESAPADVPVDIEALAEAIDAYGLALATPGDLKLSAAIAAPAGWLVCDGRAVSRATYAALFAAIGSSFGAGDGSTTFGLPDFRGRAPIGAGAGAGLTARSLGDKPGAESYALQTTDLPAHAHSITDQAHTHGPNNGDAFIEYNPNSSWSYGVAYSTTNGANQAFIAAGVTSAVTGITGTNNAGGGGAHTNMQPSLAVNVLIKT